MLLYILDVKYAINIGPTCRLLAVYTGGEATIVGCK